MSSKKRKNQQCDQAVSVIIPTQCRKCGSTERTEYGNTITLGPGVTWKELPGVPIGTAYLQLRKSYTKCLACGQSRVDEQFEFDQKVFGHRKEELLIEE